VKKVLFPTILVNCFEVKRILTGLHVAWQFVELLKVVIYGNEVEKRNKIHRLGFYEFENSVENLVHKKIAGQVLHT
jgi:hypothetical protein